MIYMATSIWLVIVILLAWAVLHLWSHIVRPRAVNVALLPGTLVAQLGRIVGLLVTGAKINNTALMEDDDKGDPATDLHYESKIPVFGPVLVGLMPMLATGAVLYYLMHYLGKPVVMATPSDQITPELPRSLSAFWDQMRSLITLSEGTLNAVLQVEMSPWRRVLFVYLMICLTVRMAPFAGNTRGHLGAALAMGVILALVATISTKTPQLIEQQWPLLSLAVGWLLLLVMVSLLARGTAMTIRAIINWQS